MGMGCWAYKHGDHYYYIGDFTRMILAGLFLLLTAVLTGCGMALAVHYTLEVIK